MMAINLVKEYVKERDTFLESIFESTRFLKRVFNNKSRKSNDIEIDRITFEWESERLNGILREFKGLYTKHESALLNLPYKAFKIELRLYKEVVKTVTDVLKSAPQRLKVIKVAPILICLETQVVEVVPSHGIEKVTSEIVQNVSRVIVKRTLPRYVSSVVINEAQVVKAVQPRKVLEVAQNVSCVIVKFAAPFVSHVVVKETQTQSVSNVVDRHSTKFFEVATVGFIESVQEAESNFSLVLANDFEVSNTSFYVCQNYVMKVSNNELNYRSVINGFYCKLLMKCFWAYFMFTDFSKLNLIGSDCDHGFQDFLCYFNVYICVVKIKYLDGGECYCRMAVNVDICL